MVVIRLHDILSNHVVLIIYRKRQSVFTVARYIVDMCDLIVLRYMTNDTSAPRVKKKKKKKGCVKI